MQAPELPQGEALRIQTLKALKILDTPTEERFDRLTRMAKRMFRVPISLVSLVDEDRQWFKSCVGLDASETPRDISFCGHAILGDDVFYIPDAAADPRFADNPLVVDAPYIRFYAGCPLRSLDGSKMGTLCIIDQEPRTLDAEDLDSLKDLAHMVERELAAVQLATLDELTDLTNRRGFLTLATNTLKLCARQDIPATLVFIDLNKFKLINDNFGHAEGDRALVTFANEMKVQCRDSDLFARISGDEFAMLLTNASKQQAERVIERLKKALLESNREARRPYELSFSHGIVEYDPTVHQSVEALLAEGDSLMYRSKHTGARNHNARWVTQSTGKTFAGTIDQAPA